MTARKSLFRCHESSLATSQTDINSLHNWKKTVRPVSGDLTEEHIVKFKCNKVHQGIYDTKNVLLKNPEWSSFNDNSFVLAVYLPDCN